MFTKIEKSIIKKVNRKIDGGYDNDDFYGLVDDELNNYYNGAGDEHYNVRSWWKVKSNYYNLSDKERKYFQAKFPNKVMTAPKWKPPYSERDRPLMKWKDKEGKTHKLKGNLYKEKW